jgi:hypothetical protein
MSDMEMIACLAGLLKSMVRTDSTGLGYMFVAVASVAIGRFTDALWGTAQAAMR